MDRHPQAEGLSLKLPVAGGALATYRLLGPRRFERPAQPFTRRALAAAHVVADPFSARDPWLETAIENMTVGDTRQVDVPVSPRAKWLPRSSDVKVIYLEMRLVSLERAK